MGKGLRHEERRRHLISAHYGLQLDGAVKIKTVQSNTFLKTLDIVGNDLIKTLNNNIAIFHWTDFDDSKVKLG